MPAEVKKPIHSLGDTMKEHIKEVKEQLRLEFPHLHYKKGSVVRTKTEELLVFRKLMVSRIHPNIEMIDEFTGAGSHNIFQCNMCTYEWSTMYSNVVNSGTGCSQCSGKLPLTNSVIDEHLKSRSIKRIGNYVGSKSPMLLRCTIDGFEWKAVMYDILRGVGCPKCSGNLPLTNAIVDERLAERGIKRIGEYTSSRSPILLRCIIDGFEWKSSTNNIFKGSGCPKCAGKNHNCLYVWKASDNIYKIGISNIDKVYTRIKSTASANNMNYEIIAAVKVTNARELETILHKKYTNNPYLDSPHLSGYTEFRVLTDIELESVLETIHSFTK